MQQSYITQELLLETKQIFEPKFGRKLTDIEGIEIGDSLAMFVETWIKFKFGQKQMGENAN